MSVFGLMLLVVLLRLSFFQAELNFLSIDFSCRFNPAGIFFHLLCFISLKFIGSTPLHCEKYRTDAIGKTWIE